MITKSKFLLVTIVALILCFATTSDAQTDAERDWVDSRFWPVVEELMPIERDQLMNVGFRTHRDLYRNILEYSFLLTYDYPKNAVTGVQRIPETVSIYDQLMRLHQQNPNESIDNLKKLVRIKEAHFTEQQCPAIHSLFFEFNKISFHGPPSDLIVLHPMVYEFKSNVGAGNMYLSVVEPNQPLVRWALRVQSTLKACGSRNR